MKRSNTGQELIMPIFSKGRHRSPRQGACFMEFASYLAGERWSDHPDCTHPVVAALARDVNDVVNEESRLALAAMVHRVVGLQGSDPGLTALIAIHAAATALPVVSMDRQRALAAGILNAVDKAGTPEASELAERAFMRAPDARRWARRHLDVIGPVREFNNRVATAMVHTAVVGIALACVDDPNARLVALLESTIDTVEARLAAAHYAPRAAMAEVALV